MADPKRICSIEGCSNRHFGRGYCENHYRRWLKYGHPLGCRRASPAKSVPESCTINGCEKPCHAKGWCVAHYTKYLRHGDPLGGKTSTGVPLQWIMNHVNYEGDECLPWTFAKGRSNYGVVWFRGQMHSAPRVMCTLAHGEPPSDLHHTAHSCGKGHEGCVNPKHLRWATIKENHADKLVHGTHNRGERSPGSRLTEDEARQILALKGIVSGRELAKMYNVHFATISAIHTGKNWGWIK